MARTKGALNRFPKYPLDDRIPTDRELTLKEVVTLNRTCSCCGTTKKLNFFYKKLSRPNYHVYSRQCMDCERKRHREWDKRTGWSRTKVQNERARKLGFEDWSDYKAKKNAQYGLPCPVCDKPFNKGIHYPTRMYRADEPNTYEGWVCRKCNNVMRSISLHPTLLDFLKKYDLPTPENND